MSRKARLTYGVRGSRRFDHNDPDHVCREEVRHLVLFMILLLLLLLLLLVMLILLSVPFSRIATGHCLLPT